MSADPAVTSVADNVPLPRPTKTSKGLRRFTAIEDNAQIVKFAQSTTGRLVLFLLFVLPLTRIEGYWLQITIAAALCAYAGGYRSYALTATTAVFLGMNTNWFGLYPLNTVQATGYLCFLIFSIAYLKLAQYNQKWFVTRRPVVTLLLITATLTVIASSSLVHGLALDLLWAFIETFVKFVWFLAYALVDQRMRSRSPLHFQLGTFHPFWGSTNTPFGKGAAYLRKAMAKTPEELAITQIKGVKLMYWAFVLSAINKALKLMYGHFHIPLLADVQAAYAAGHPYSASIGWASLAWATAQAVIGFTINGHRIIAIARLAGFRLQRNTWRPLEARTLVDFWNRYAFYFKEVMVEFFFLPTFLATFRNSPRLRLFFATFMAAGVGNLIYHFVRDINAVKSMGLLNAIIRYEGYIFYSVVLATGIAISQIRVRKDSQFSSSVIGRLWSFIVIWSFFVSIYIFGEEYPLYTLGERLSFMGNLFGVK